MSANVAQRTRTMVTPEGLALPIVLARRSARMGALILDLVFMALIMIAGTVALASIAGGVVGLQGIFAKGSQGLGALQFLAISWIVAMFLLRYAWFLAFELGPRGASPGKRIVGIRVAARHGGRLTPEMIIARNLLRDIELFLPIMLLFGADSDAGAMWLVATAWFCLFLGFVFTNRDRLRAGDVIAGTWVVETPRVRLGAVMSATGPARGAQPGFVFTEAELAPYGEYELKVLERVLREDRDAALAEVHGAIAAKLGRRDGYGHEHRFLADYYTQLRARLESGMRMGRRKADKFSGP